MRSRETGHAETPTASVPLGRNGMTGPMDELGVLEP